MPDSHETLWLPWRAQPMYPLSRAAEAYGAPDTERWGSFWDHFGRLYVKTGMICDADAEAELDQLRNYLADVEPLPYIQACIVAIEHSAWGVRAQAVEEAFTRLWRLDMSLTIAAYEHLAHDSSVGVREIALDSVLCMLYGVGITGEGSPVPLDDDTREKLQNIAAGAIADINSALGDL